MLTERDIKILQFIEEHGAITINQTYKMFYQHAKYGHDLARKRLQKLKTTANLKTMVLSNGISKELIYYKDKPISAHTLLLLNFFAELISNGAKIHQILKEPKFKKVRPDALVIYGYKDYEIIDAVEVVLTHQVDYKNYEEQKSTEEIQKEFGVFPRIIVIANNPKIYEGNSLTVKYVDYHMKNFYKVLP